MTGWEPFAVHAERRPSSSPKYPGGRGGLAPRLAQPAERAARRARRAGAVRRPRLVVMLKEPRPGRVKTRLARDVGAGPAARWFRGRALALLRGLRDPRWETVLAVAPDAAGLAGRTWPPDLPRLPQGPGDLGDRMGRLMRSLPPGPVLIVGADIPGITRAQVAGAFAALGRAPAAIGPVDDGGYWGIGLARTAAVPARLFDGVRWSTARARADTEATLPRPIATLPPLRDVDTASDLDALGLPRPW